MDLFLKAESVKLSSHKDKVLVAEEDRMTVSLDQDTSAKNAIWSVEFVEGKAAIRLKSCFGTYLTASSIPFVPGATGKKVIQARPCQCDSGAAEWEPLRDGMQVRLRSLWGNFLRPNGGIPPWRNSITHDIPHRVTTRDKILWDVHVVEKCQERRIPASDSEVVDKQSDSVRRVLLSNEMEQNSSKVKCWWYPKVRMPFPI